MPARINGPDSVVYHLLPEGDRPKPSKIDAKAFAQSAGKWVEMTAKTANPFVGFEPKSRLGKLGRDLLSGSW